MRHDDSVLAALADLNPIPAAQLSAFTAAFDSEELLGRARKRADGDRRNVNPPRLHYGAVALVLLALVAVGAASAFTLGWPTISFLSGGRGPSWAFVSLEKTQRVASFELGRKLPRIALAAPARRITDVRYDGRDHDLVVAPLKGGGYCFSWRGPYLGSECRTPQSSPRAVDAQMPGDAGGPILLSGTITRGGGAKLVVRYQDGRVDQIPVVWVTEPINAGFFLYPLTAAHRHPGHRPVELRLLGPSGADISVTRLPPFLPLPPVHKIAGFGSITVPRAALYKKRRLLFQTTVTIIRPETRRGGGVHRYRIALWAAPARGGGTCYWFGNSQTGSSGGCIPAHYNGGASLSADPYSDIVCCWAGPNATRIELRYQDGDRATLTPRSGYILAAIPPDHLRRGHRLTAIIILDRHGHPIAAGGVPPPGRPGSYPCLKPSLHVAGSEMCP